MSFKTKQHNKKKKKKKKAKNKKKTETLKLIEGIVGKSLEDTGTGETS